MRRLHRKVNKLPCARCGSVISRWRATRYCSEQCATEPARAREPWQTRFWRNVDRRGPDECWPWLQSLKGNKGYGQFGISENGVKYKKSAHRLAYSLSVGPILTGMQIDHLCANKRCCNPAHMQAIERAEHTRLGWRRGQLRASRSRVTVEP